MQHPLAVAEAVEHHRIAVHVHTAVPLLRVLDPGVHAALVCIRDEHVRIFVLLRHLPGNIAFKHRVDAFT